MVRKFDFLVVGSGIAGMSFALKTADKGKVAILCKTTLDEANTALAQGGISSVTNPVLDNYEKHIQDTLIAGDGICDIDAVKKVVLNAPKEIEQLLEWGVDFDKARRVVRPSPRGRALGTPHSAPQGFDRCGDTAVADKED